MPDPRPSPSRSLMARAEARTPAPAPRPVDEVLVPPNRWTPPVYDRGLLDTTFGQPVGNNVGAPVGPLRDSVFGQPIAGTGPLPPPADRNNPLWARDVNLPAAPKKGAR